jgi:hypothetical protein
VDLQPFNEFFDVALPIGGIATVPFIGFLLDSTSTVVVLSLLVFLSTTIGILEALPFLWAAYTNVVLFVLFRPLYYSAHVVSITLCSIYDTATSFGADFPPLS